MKTYEELKTNRDFWNNQKNILVQCSWCKNEFKIKNGTLYNIIRRDSSGIYCNRKCAGSARALITQNKYKLAGGKICKRCNEFKTLNNFSTLPNPPYYRAECKRCHNYKPARHYSSIKERAIISKILFNLSFDEFLSVWSQDCYYCNQKSNNKYLILIDENFGYKQSNILMCCRVCHKMKGDFEHHLFLDYCLKISKNIENKGVKNE